MLSSASASGESVGALPVDVTAAPDVAVELPGVGSGVDDVADTLFVIVPVALLVTCSVRSNAADAPALSVAIVQVSVVVVFVQLNVGPLV